MPARPAPRCRRPTLKHVRFDFSTFRPRAGKNGPELRLRNVEEDIPSSRTRIPRRTPRCRAPSTARTPPAAETTPEVELRPAAETVRHLAIPTLSTRNLPEEGAIFLALLDAGV